MDLLTLVTACALTVEPKVMHALIWQQSGGEPWSFSVQGQGWPRVFPTMQDAIREAQLEMGRLAGIYAAPEAAATWAAERLPWNEL